jgi:hypothetical protein
MKNKNAVIIVRLVALMLTSSVTLFGGYLSKCITDPGVYSLNVGSRDKKRSCTTTVSTCNSCIDGWWQCFGASEGECAITVMMGYQYGDSCIISKTINLPSKMHCVF